MAFWRARDAYRVQTLWMALCLFVFGFPCLIMATSGHWGIASGIGAAWWLVQWALPRGLRWLIWEMQDGARWAGRWSLGKAWRWWRSLVMVLVLGCLLGGCMEAAHWWSTTQGIAFDANNKACPRAQLKDGLCQAVAQHGEKP